nr:hypothetical protein [Actinomycetota bacterium]
KADNGTVTTSGVVSLEGAERVAELSRMLAGVGESEHARSHAAELLERAQRTGPRAERLRAAAPAEADG